MALGDPFSTVYQGTSNALGSIGQAITQIGGLTADNIKKKKQLDQQTAILKASGLIKEEEDPATLDEYMKIAKTEGKKHGYQDIKFVDGATDEDKIKTMQVLFDHFGLTKPENKKRMVIDPKARIEANTATGETTIKSNQLNELTQVPEGFEVIGYDQKGQPMVRKIQRNVPAEKFDTEQQDKIKDQEEKTQILKNSAQDTLQTIGEVKKGLGNFGLTGDLPAIPGTDRYTWKSNVDKLLSEKIINVMTDLKAASKTGSTGFGQLSNKELQVLTNASTALKKGLPPKEAQKYLDQMEASFQKILQGDQKSQNQDEFSNMSDEELKAIINGR